MTVSTTTSKTVLLGNGSQSVFPFAFEIPASGDEVITYTDASGNSTVVPSSQYTVAGFGVATGGTVTYPLLGSAIASGTTLTIERVLPLQQTTSLSNQGSYFPSAVESALDYRAMVEQQLQTEVGYCISAPLSDVSPPATLPAAANRAGLYLAFDQYGNPIAAAATQYAVNATTTIDFATHLAATAAVIPSAITFIRLAGYAAVGDLGAVMATALFVKLSSAPSSPQAWQFQSADGAWWSYALPSISPEVCGARGDGATDDSAAMQAAINYAQLVGNATEGAAGAVVGRPGARYSIATTLSVTVPITFNVPYLLYTATTGACIIFGNSKTYRNWGYDITIGTVRALNGNSSLPVSVNAGGCDGVVFRCIQFSYIRIGTVIAFTRYGVFMDSTNDGAAFTNTVTGAVTISSSDSTHTLTLVGAGFQSIHAGDDITIPGAGVAGANLVTNIATVISSTQVTLVAGASTSLSAVSETVTWSGGQQNQQNNYQFSQLVFNGVGYLEDSISAATGAVNDCFVYIQDSFANVGNLNLNNGNDNNNTYEIGGLDAPSSAAGGSGYCASINGSYNQFRIGYVNGLFAFQGGAIGNRVTIGNDVSTGLVIAYGGVNNSITANGNWSLPSLVSVTDNALVQNTYGVPVTVYLSFAITPGTSGNTQVQLDLQDARAGYAAIAQYLATPVSAPAALNGTISVTVPSGWWWRAKKTLGGSGTVTYLNAWIVGFP